MHSVLLRQAVANADTDTLSSRIDRLSIKRSTPSTAFRYNVRPPISKTKPKRNLMLSHEMQLAVLLHSKEFDRAEGEGKVPYIRHALGIVKDAASLRPAV
jgi:hypothetical protein